MRTPTLILSLTTATFAVTTGWLAWELHQRDTAGEVIGAQLAPGAAIAANGQAPIAGTLARVPATQMPGAASTDTLPSTAPDVDAGATRGKPNLSQDPSVMYARQFLARYDDSAQRQVQLEEARAGVRRQYAQLKEQLGLSDEKFEQIVDLIAQSNLQGQEVWARCAVDADCDSSRPHPELVDDRSQELLALLGPGQIDAFNRYRSALGERDSVASFRGRLSDAQFLPQAQAEQLIAALSQERERYSQEIQQSGSTVRGWGTNLGMVMYPESANTAEAQLAAALQYSERMRARAATVLTPAQLAAFVQMQEELLAQLALFVHPTPPRKANTLKLAQG
jgi:hypothetical protein